MGCNEADLNIGMLFCNESVHTAKCCVRSRVGWNFEIDFEANKLQTGCR